MLHGTCSMLTPHVLVRKLLNAISCAFSFARVSLSSSSHTVPWSCCGLALCLAWVTKGIAASVVEGEKYMQSPSCNHLVILKIEFDGCSGEGGPSTVSRRGASRPLDMVHPANGRGCALLLCLLLHDSTPTAAACGSPVSMPAHAKRLVMASEMGALLTDARGLVPQCQRWRWCV